MIVELIVIIITSVLIYYAGEYFATASSLLGQRLQLNKSVKGATFDAVSSSLPELIIALFSVIAFGSFDVGVGTIAGSALFNLLIIPAAAIFVAGGKLQLSKMVVHRDVGFHLISKIVLLAMVFFVASWDAVLAVALLVLYIIYIIVLLHDKTKSPDDESLPSWSPVKTAFIAFISVIVMGASAYFLTEYSILFAQSLGVPPLLIAFTIVAAATSVPDLVISLVNAKKQSGDDAMSNVMGSNTFDILVGLGLPLLIASLLSGPVAIAISHPELITLLFLVSLGFTVLVQKRELRMWHAWLFFWTYILITGYVVFLAVI